MGCVFHLVQRLGIPSFKDMNTQKKMITYEGIKVVVEFEKIGESIIIDKICTLDGQNIIDLIRDRTITVIELMLRGK